MEQPTETQIKEFWEWCGLPYDGYGNTSRLKAKNLPVIDLNNLFKYAVPKLIDMKYEITVRCFDAKWEVNLFAGQQPYKDYDLQDVDDPALALFWALWQVKESKQ